MATSIFTIVGGKPTAEIDPDDELDFSLIWDQFLPSDDTVSSAAWSISPAGPLVYGEAINALPRDMLGFERRANTVTTCWVKTLEAGQTYNLRCRMTSTGGRKKDFTLVLKVADQ